MNDLYNKLRDGQDVHLLESEKLAIKSRILRMPNKESRPGFILSLVQLFSNSKIVITAVLTLVCILSIPLAYASQKSGPGQLLHSFEIHFLEEIEQSFQFTKQSKISYSTNRIKERLLEMQDVSDNKLSVDETKMLTKNLEEHVDNVLAELPDDATDEEVEGLIAVSALLHAHQDVFSEANNEQEGIENLNDDVTQQLAKTVQKYADEQSSSELNALITENTNEALVLIQDDIQNPETQQVQEHLNAAKKEITDGDLDSALDEAIAARIEALAQEYTAEK